MPSTPATTSPNPPTSPAVKAVTGGGAFVSGAAALVSLVAAFIHHGDPTPYFAGAAAFIGASSVFALGLVWHHHPAMSAWANRIATDLPGTLLSVEAVAPAVVAATDPNMSTAVRQQIESLPAVVAAAVAEAVKPSPTTASPPPEAVANAITVAQLRAALVDPDNPTGMKPGPAGVVRPVHPGDPGEPVDPHPSA